jgi:hypothetical protein
MAKSNPLQQYFRQPKIYITLPMSNLFSEAGTVQTSDQIPVFGMTGMDEIILKTPDALLSGESIAKVIKSCCPAITNPWALCNIDIDLILTAIRIATYGNNLEASDRCENCTVENHYDIDLSRFIEHFQKSQFDSKIVLKELVIKLRPLTYEEANKFALESFAIQKKTAQVYNIENEEEQKVILTQLFEDMSDLQKKIILESVDQIELPNVVVTEKTYINEYLENCDRVIFDSIKNQFEINNEVWKVPRTKIKCEHCGHESELAVEINQTTFFDGA